MELGGGQQEPPGLQEAVGAPRPKAVRSGLDVNNLGTRFLEGLVVRTPQLSLWLWGVGEGPPLLAPQPVRGVGRWSAQAQTLAVLHPAP